VESSVVSQSGRQRTENGFNLKEGMAWAEFIIPEKTLSVNARRTLQS
jgi:hypothetical protein